MKLGEWVGRGLNCKQILGLVWNAVGKVQTGYLSGGGRMMLKVL